MSLINESENTKEVLLNHSPYEQLTSIQERMTSLENQIKEIESDLPLNVSKSIINMQEEIQKLTEISDSQPVKEVPFVYSEIIEKIGDFQRRVEWKIKDVVQNKILDANLLFEENEESPRENEENKKSDTLEFQNKISESLENLKSSIKKTFEENKKSLNDLEAQLFQIKFQIKAESNAPFKIASHLSNEIDLQQRQINELERTLNNMPDLINNSRRLTDKFSSLYQPKESIQSSTNPNNDKKIDFQNNNDISMQFSTLESEIQATISSLQLDLENVVKRIDMVDEQSNENEKQINEIAESQQKAAKILSEIEDDTLSMLDKADNFTSNFSVTSNLAPLEEVENETRKQLRTFKREISTIKYKISKKEAQISQYYHSTS